MQPRLGDPTQAQVTDSSAARRALSAALARRVGTTVLATTSVRLCVAPPARKKRRRTRPTTSSSCPEGHSSAAGGASNQATGTDSAGPPSGLTLSSSARTVSPEGKVRASGARVRVPTRIDRLVPAAGRVLVGMGSSDVEWRVGGGRILNLRPACDTRTASSSGGLLVDRSEEHTSELQSLMRTSYAVFCLKKKINKHPPLTPNPH